MRTQVTTERVKTAFGSMYVHLHIDDSGHPVGLAISTPGKADNTQLDDVIRQLADATSGVLADATRRATAFSPHRAAHHTMGDP